MWEFASQSKFIQEQGDIVRKSTKIKSFYVCLGLTRRNTFSFGDLLYGRMTLTRRSIQSGIEPLQTTTLLYYNMSITELNVRLVHL